MQAQVAVSLVVDPWSRSFRLQGGHPGGRDSLHELISSWPGWRREPQLGTHNGQACSSYRAEAWPSAVLPLSRSRLEVAWTPEARTEAQALLESVDRAQQALKRDGQPVAMFGCRGGRPPMPHQVQMLAAVHELGSRLPILLREDMGLGKTTTALLSWRKISGCKRALVVCPKSVKLNWLAEAELVLGEELPRVFLIDGSSTQRANILGYMRAAADAGEEGLAVVNYDLLRSINPVGWTALERWVHRQALLCDEFHYCKDSDSKRTRAVADLAARSTFRMGLTGTPVRNTVEDLYSQLEILRPHTWVSYSDFANRHLVVSRTQFPGARRAIDVVRGGKNLEALNEVVATVAFGRKKDEVLTLPPKVHSKPLLELDGAHLEVYQAMKQEAKVALERLIGEQGDLTLFNPVARNSLESALRCEQIAQGFLSALPEFYLEQHANWISKHCDKVEGYPGARVFRDSPKLTWLKETLEALSDRRVVVFSRFNAPLYWLAEQNPETTALLVGALSTEQRHEVISSFRKGERRVLACQVKLAEGFNLTEAQDVVFLGRDWSPAINLQAEARCHRIGTQGTVNIQIPVVQNTVEKFLDSKLAAKDADAQQALRNVTIRELMEAL